MFKLILQCIPLLAFPILGAFFSLQQPFYSILSLIGIEVEYIIEFLNFFSLNDRGISIITGFLISVFILISFRKVNKQKVFNTGNKYGKYPLYIYFIASKILGFGYVSLVRIPIYLQFHLVLKDLFDNVMVDNNISDVDEDAPITLKNMDRNFNEMNLILNDTYENTIEQIPENKRCLPTVIINNGNEFNGIRTFNRKFIEQIRKQTNYYSKDYEYINIFATTNPNHNKVIVESCFKNAERTGFTNLTVFQYNSTKNYFDEKYTIL